MLNELFLWSVDSSALAVDRRTRLAWMDHVVRQCQLFTGSLAGSMCHDESYSFLEIGRFLDRADMTTRVLDVQAEILIGQAGDKVKPYADITWMNVLQSLDTLRCSSNKVIRERQGWKHCAFCSKSRDFRVP